jgi:hypothetical protein
MVGTLRFAHPTNGLSRHCEERSDEAIQSPPATLDCFASLAMTVGMAVAGTTWGESRAYIPFFCRFAAADASTTLSTSSRQVMISAARIGWLKPLRLRSSIGRPSTQGSTMP